MRRYFSDRLYVSPSKEKVRRRLFEPPKKSYSLQTKFVVFFSFFGVTFLIGVHLFLFKHVLRSTDNSSHYHPSKLGPNIVQDSKQISAGGGLQNSVNNSNSNQWPPTTERQTLRQLRPVDVEQYTIRMNSWRRPEQLLVSVDHHASCEGVAQIQIVWCDKENEPPPQLYNYSKVVIERHEENSLNERFRILSPTPTLGILSIDDDALRPCEALDAGFFKWTRFPDRMVGYDARVHVENPDGSWKYGYMSTMEKTNTYSLSLTRYCFVHRDYMYMYINELPSYILDTVAKNLNCEDIAMSFMISSLTNGKSSLLADLWAMKSMIKLFAEEKISGGKSHKSLRDECVDTFSKLLGLKDDSNRLRTVPYTPKPHTFFECGDDPGAGASHQKSEREVKFDNLMQRWHDQGNAQMLKEVKALMSKAGSNAYKQGLIQKTEKWKERFQAAKDGKED